MKKMLALVLVSMMILSCSAALAEGTLLVGMECNYAPFNWTQTDENEYTVPIDGDGLMGYADGYDVQIAKHIADYLDMELVIKKTEWDGLPIGVQSGMLDLIIAGMSPTEDRKASLDFSDAYYTSELVIVVRKDSKYAAAKSLEDMKGALITGQLNTFHYSVLSQIPDTAPAMAMDTFPAMVIATRSGMVDGYVAERPGAEADCLANPDLTFITFEEGKGFVASEADVSIAVGLQKGSPLLEKINEALSQLDADTRYQMMEDAKLRQPLSE